MYSLSGSPSQYFDVLANPEAFQKFEDFYGKIHRVGMVDYFLNLQPFSSQRLGQGGVVGRGALKIPDFTHYKT